MKHKFFVTIILIFCFLFISSAFLMAQEEEEEFAQERPNPWELVKADRGLNKLQIRKLGNGRFFINMRGIRNTINKAGINEKITIILQTKNGRNIAVLGSYTPARGRSFRGRRFSSMRNGFEDPLTALGPYFKNKTIKRAMFRLAFKNSKGSIMALKLLQIAPAGFKSKLSQKTMIR
ncbi:MAG: hypothetical protein ABFR75_02190 [Acidobacteriota bacterium]